jgi:hypothetical protein
MSNVYPNQGKWLYDETELFIQHNVNALLCYVTILFISGQISMLSQPEVTDLCLIWLPDHTAYHLEVKVLADLNLGWTNCPQF